MTTTLEFLKVKQKTQKVLEKLKKKTRLDPVIYIRLVSHGTCSYMYINNNIIIVYLFTAIGLLPGGSGYFTCKQNMKLVTTKFRWGGLHEKHVVMQLQRLLQLYFIT